METSMASMCKFGFGEEVGGHVTKRIMRGRISVQLSFSLPSLHLQHVEGEGQKLIGFGGL